MTIYHVEIVGEFFDDAGWSYENQVLSKTFYSKAEAQEYADKVQDGIIEVDCWDRIQDPDNVAIVVEVEK